MIRSISLCVIVVVLFGCADAASGAQPVRDTVRVAAPTGERAADRASVQAALDAVQLGGTVAFAPGIYVIGGDGLVLRTPGVALIGHPASTTLQGCTREERIGVEANEFLEACGDGLVLAAEAQRVSRLRFESFSLPLSIREASESEKLGRSPGFTGGHVVEDNSFHDGFSFELILDADSTIRIRRNVFRNTWHAVAIGGRNIHVTHNDIAVPEPERVPFGHGGVAIGIRPLGDDGACSSMVVAGNRIEGHTVAVGIAVFPQDPPGAECSHITIRDNEIVMRRVRMPDGSDEAGRLAIAPAIRLHNAQRLVGEGLITWGEHWMPEGGWPAALSDGRISDVSVAGNHITGAVGVAIEAAHVTDSRIVDNEIEVRPATTAEERDGLSVGGNGFPGVWVTLGLVDEVNGTPVWVSPGSEGTVVRPPTAPAGAQAHGGSGYSDVPTARVDAIFSDLDSERSPGCALGVFEAGAPVYMNGYGMASLEHGIPMSPRSVLSIASISKQFTALSIILLARAGELSLDDPVRDYIPELPEYAAPVTLRHLIHHTSGLRDNVSLLRLARGQVEADGDEVMLSGLRWQKALNFPPGDHWMYSSGGYALLAMVVERVTGDSFREFTDREIFGPLGMTDTSFDWPVAVDGLALAYAPNGEDQYRLSIPTHSFAGPAGLYTTIRDLANWDRNFYRAEVGGSDGIALMHVPGRLSSGEELTYAAGLELGSYRGLPTVWHSGGDPGYATMMVRFPDQRLSVALLCNVMSAAPWFRVYQVADLYLEDHFLGPSPASASVGDDLAVAEADLEALTGVYRSTDGIVVQRIDHEDGVLLVTAGGARFPLQQIGVHEFGDDSTPHVLTLSDPCAGEGLIATWSPDPIQRKVDPLRLERVGAPWEPDRDALTDFLGTFFSRELDATWEIVERDAALLLRRWGMPDQALEPLLPDTWVFGGSTEPRLRFERDAAGTVNALSLANSQILGVKFVRN